MKITKKATGKKTFLFFWSPQRHCDWLLMVLLVHLVCNLMLSLWKTTGGPSHLVPLQMFISPVAKVRHLILIRCQK